MNFTTKMTEKNNFSIAAHSIFHKLEIFKKFSFYIFFFCVHFSYLYYYDATKYEPREMGECSAKVPNNVVTGATICAT